MTYANMTALSLKIARTCSQCGNVGHNARTCIEQHTVDSTAKTNNSSIMLFGVRLTPMESSPSPCSSASSSSSFRKCMSMNNLAQYEQQQQHHEGRQLHYSGGDVGGSGYASDDGHASGIRNRERKKGVPWTEEEHKLFLVGLNQVGKGDWRGISRNFVKTKTPTQVASHAQKYFLRRTNLNRRRRRSSLFDITTDTISRSASAGQLNNLDTTLNSKQAPNQANLFSSPCPTKLPPILTNHANTTSIVTMPPSSLISNLNINPSHTSPPPKSSIVINTNTREREFEPFLSLSLSRGPSNEEQTQPSNTFGGFNGNDKNTVRVA